MAIYAIVDLQRFSSYSRIRIRLPAKSHRSAHPDPTSRAHGLRRNDGGADELV